MSARPLHVVEADLADGWETYRDQWERELEAQNRRPLTIKAYVDSFTRLARWAVGVDGPAGREVIEDPTEISRDDLVAFLGWSLARTTRNGRKAAPSSVAKDYRHLRVLFGWLTEIEEIDTNPIAKIKEPAVPEKLVPILSDDDLRALVAACAGREFTDRRDLAMIRCLFDMGIRREELHGMTVDAFDLRARLVRVTGKGDRDRVVSYGNGTATALDAYLRARRKHKDRALPDMWLAGSPHSGALGYDGVLAMLKRRARIAGVEGVHTHRFRHTAAHALLKAGSSEGDAMRLFGWKSRTMVDRYGKSAAHERAIETARNLSPGDRI